MVTLAQSETRELRALIDRLPGRIPDDGLALLRMTVGLGDGPTALEMLGEVVASGVLVATADDLAALRQLYQDFDLDPASLDDVQPGQLDALPYTFAAPAPDDEEADDLDEIVILAAVGAELIDLGDDDGQPTIRVPEPPLVARAVWRVARTSARATVDVYVVELIPGADPAAVSFRIHEALVEAGEVVPRVEVLGEDTELSAYHEAAMAAGELVWIAEEPVVPTLAAVFDGADETGQPFFRPDHLVLEPDERSALLDYLRGGELSLASLGQLDDIVTGERDQVPLGYRSDGVWIWSEASAYYLERHGFAPDPGLRDWITTGAPAIPPTRLSHLQRHLVFEALTAPDADGP